MKRVVSDGVLVLVREEIHDAAGRILGCDWDDPDALRLALRIESHATLMRVAIEERQRKEADG